MQSPTLFLAEVPGWTSWAPWSACSRSCLIPGGGPALRSRSRLCPSPGDMSCPGEATQEEPCSPSVCLGMAPSEGGALEWGEAQMKRRTFREGWGQTWLLPRSFSLAPSHRPPRSPAGDAQGGPGLKACWGQPWRCECGGGRGCRLDPADLRAPHATLTIPHLCHVPDHCWLSLPPRAGCLGSVGRLVRLLRPV